YRGAVLGFLCVLGGCSGMYRLFYLRRGSYLRNRLLSLSGGRGYGVGCVLIDSLRVLVEAVDSGDEARSVDLLARIMAEAASRLRSPDEGVEAQVLKGRDHGGAADDQWSRLREGTP